MTRTRELGLDAARGLAVVSMFFAHFAPGTGPGNVTTLSEHLTAFLFALLIGCGAELGRSSERRWRASQVRATALVVVGLLLMQLDGVQIVVVLVWLGILTVIALWLTHLPAWGVAAVGAGALLAEPVLLERLRNWLVTQPHDPITTAAVEVLFTGGSYRISAFLVPACAGILLVRLTHSSAQRLLVGGATGAAAATMLLLHKTDLLTLVPYSGDRQELVFNTLLALAATCLAWALASRTRPIGLPLAAMGSMALTLYTAQVVGDWAYFRGGGTSDDQWPLLAVACMVAVVFALAWLPVSRATGWRGPLEGPIDVIAKGHR